VLLRVTWFLESYDAEHRAQYETDCEPPQLHHSIDGDALSARRSEPELTHPLQGQHDIGDLMLRVVTERV
jgi:hypothetical protein